MSGCEHESLFTTAVFRVLVSDGRFRPHSTESRRISQSCPLQWDQENAFYFRGSKPSLMQNDYKIKLNIEHAEPDLEYSMWTEDAKGNVLNGKKDHFSANYEVTLSANLNTAFVCARVRTVTCRVCAAISNVLHESRSMDGYTNETLKASSCSIGQQPTSIKTPENVWDDHCDEPTIEGLPEW